MVTIYVLYYNFCWGYEDYGSEVLWCFRSQEQAEQAAYWLNETRAPCDVPYINYDVYEASLT